MNVNELISAVAEAPEIVVLGIDGKPLSVNPDQIRIGMCALCMGMHAMFNVSKGERTQVKGFTYTNGRLTFDAREVMPQTKTLPPADCMVLMAAMSSSHQ